ncbi:3'-5' exonuclease [Psychrosphaera sp. B3R10]|uniref:3'-5' exonuclease n=1 Tax=unclassified Psychrosphaera TaxID=2641570 RepID=UPI001C0A08F1|nr:MULTISPECIES: 3'-5' exonuclease [unclassified Psychrosphaera]MBU2882260.1 3'-5' exonuclease [Psychrosphaera sp. I2R16]MBU2988941.1 3'-5' exonuclease [Psychrosphaera sp. B3R10]
MNAHTVIVLDFETTGLSPDNGDRTIEIGAVKLVNGVITERFQELMDPGRPINYFIEDYTGITNQMLSSAAPCGEVMARFADFIQGHNLVAHNASFDKRFLDSELQRISADYDGDFACSLLLSRRLYQDAPNHKLGTLVNYKNIESNGSFHRALYDSEMTAKLWLVMLNDIEQQTSVSDVPFSLIQRLSKMPKKNIDTFLAKL